MVGIERFRSENSNEAADTNGNRRVVEPVSFFLKNSIVKKDTANDKSNAAEH